MDFILYILGTLVILLLLFVIVVFCSRRHAKRLVKQRTDEEKCRDLNKALLPFGFQYDLCQDIFFATKDAWQRKTGYGKIYDEHAVGMNMDIDCEPIYFTCNNKSYMLEFWKGQYGILTGGEIGLYVTDEVDAEHPEKLFYHSVSDEEMPAFRFTLRKNGRIMMIRDEIHWWLTGFCLGEYSLRKELGMEISVCFKSFRMREAFRDALLKTGYHRDNVYADGNCVRFAFTIPLTRQPKHTRLHVWLVRRMNRKNCKRYLRVTKCFVRTIDRVDYLGMCFPHLYKKLGKICRTPAKKCSGKKRPKLKRNKCR